MGQNEKKIIDILDWNTEFTKLRERLSILEKRFIAVGLDYQHYIDDTWGQKEIYKLRDDVSYRLFCSQFHVELLLRHHIQIINTLHERHKSEPEFFSRQYVGANPWYEQFAKEVSGIFDSMVYHSASTFDYVSILSNYICGPNKQEKLKWTQLARSVRDTKSQNPFTTTKIASVIDKIDKEFVGKLYNHRSQVIHKKSDLNKYLVKMTFSTKGISFDAKFFIGDNLIKEFSQLKELSKTNKVTVVYAAFWIINETVSRLTDILFALKNQMESAPQTPHGSLVFLDEKTNTITPVSSQWWHEDEYKKTAAN